MPGYGGNATVFGVSVRMAPTLNDRAAQRNAYPGLSGVELIDLGGRGRMTTIRGRLFGSTVGNLMAAKAILESYVDNVPRVLVDTAGIAWPNVVLHPPRFIDRWTPGAGGFTWAYEQVAEHLTSA